MRSYQWFAAATTGLMLGVSSAVSADAWYIGANSYEQTLNNNTVHDRERVQTCTPLVCTTSTVNRDYRGRFDTDRHPGIVLGFKDRGGWRTEFEYKEADFGIRSAQSKEDSIESRRLMASFWRDFKFKDSPLGSYLGFGIGAAELEQGPADEKFAIAQVGAGLTYAVTRQLNLDLGYRLYSGDPDIRLEDDNRAIDLDYRGHSFNFGIRYYLY